MNKRLSFTHELRLTYRYKKYRKEIRKRDNNKCIACENKTKIVHHWISFGKLVGSFLKQFKEFHNRKDRIILLQLAMWYEPFWNLDNANILCSRCHKKADKINKKYKEAIL